MLPHTMVAIATTTIVEGTALTSSLNPCILEGRSKHLPGIRLTVPVALVGRHQAMRARIPGRTMCYYTIGSKAVAVVALNLGSPVV